MSFGATESQFQDAVADYARLRGWRVAHFRPARTKGGWRTAGQYDAQGFPDLVLVRSALVLAELKSESGRLSQPQREWARAIAAAQVPYYLWRPSDWPAIEAILR